MQRYASLNQERQKPLYGTLLNDEELETVFEVLLDAVIVISKEGRLLFANTTACMLFGFDQQSTYSSDDLKLMARLSIRDVCGQPLPMEHWSFYRVLQGETLKKGDAPDVMIRSYDGRDLILDCCGIPRKNAQGEITGAILIMKDVTELHKVEQDTNNVLMSLREAHKRMDEFLSMASHELKTPLTAINGYISLANEYLATISSSIAVTDHDFKPVQEMLARAERHGDLMHRLVNDLLDVSRILGSKLRFDQKPCNLNAIVYDIVKDQSYMVPDRTIYLKLPVDQAIPIFADADRIGQVVMNYLTNAFKYTPHDQPVEVQLYTKNGYAHVTVCDHGPGLSCTEQQRIWQRFYQSDEIEVQNGTDGGLGLGLYICRTIIEYHKGQVGIDSTLGEGSTFWFTLPLQQDEEQL